MVAKTIVITGIHSYVGNHFESWLKSFDGRYKCFHLDLRDDGWRDFCFDGVDAIVHVSAIVHQQKCDDWESYKRVNVDLTQNLAEHAKSCGVPQFVFLSTMAVYGKGKSLSPIYITEDTEADPKSLYGRSKYMAEEKLRELADERFTVSIVRPTNIYGPGCSGNYIPAFMTVASRLPVIPDCYQEVKQGLLYIDNLSELLRLVIENKSEGLFLPQDSPTLSSFELLAAMRRALGKNVRGSRFLGCLASIFRRSKVFMKAYGGVAYSLSHEPYDGKYRVVDVADAIQLTVGSYV